MSVDIKATFSKKERPRNGLESIVKDLVTEPLTPRLVIGIVQCPTTKINNREGGARTPVVEFVFIEPMITQAEEAAARRLFDQAFKARTGKAPEPLSVQDPLPLDGDDEDDHDEDNDD